MNTNQRPPVPHRRGIAIVQSSKTQKNIEDGDFSSGIGSVRSSSRSRGISISRSSGIKMDKIYQQKHFPPPVARVQKAESSQNLQKTLGTCKSLRLVSVKSETASTDKTSQLKVEGNFKEDSDIESFQLSTNSKNNEERGVSPIGKLSFGAGNSQINKLITTEKQKLLINF